MMPTNNLVGPLLTDMYQLTMVYAYWKNGRHEDHAVFDLYFRKNPFKGEFAIAAGMEEVVRFLSSFRFTKEDINYVRTLMPHCEEEFFAWLATVDCSQIKVFSVDEGSVTFAPTPLLRVEGPLAIAQLLETGLLNLTNFATLMTTNAARFRLAAGPDKTLLEFGLRRAQGPDGAISASRYAYIGGFDATSNVLAGKLFGIPVRGTHAHAFVSSYTGLKDLKNKLIRSKDDSRTEIFATMVLDARDELGFTRTNEGELAAFIAYARAFQDGFLALVDTYDTLKSGVPNFLCVALALHRLGYKPIGVRLDSGDLAYLSKETREMFRGVKQADFSNLVIAASNDINEEVLWSLAQQGHEIDTFGIGTHLVTCQEQPALGCVYKLVEINGQPRIKLSEQQEKTTIPGKKVAYRLIGKEGYLLLDLLALADEEAPRAEDQILCLHPTDPTKRVLVTPTAVEPLHQCLWNGKEPETLMPIQAIRVVCALGLSVVRPDHLRPVNPTPYKVSLTPKLHQLFRDLWAKEAPIAEIR